MADAFPSIICVKGVRPLNAPRLCHDSSAAVDRRCLRGGKWSKRASNTNGGCRCIAVMAWMRQLGFALLSASNGGNEAGRSAEIAAASDGENNDRN
jgi:hypothetical protein